MNAQHKMNLRRLQSAVNRFSRKPNKAGAFEAVEAALEQVKFDRMEVETEPEPAAAEEPEPEDDGA